MWDANLEKIDWIWNQCTAEDKAHDGEAYNCSWGGAMTETLGICKLFLFY